MQFETILRRAGDWAGALQLIGAKLKKESNSLTVRLRAPVPIGPEREEILRSLIREELPGFHLELIVEAEEAPAVNISETVVPVPHVTEAPNEEPPAEIPILESPKAEPPAPPPRPAQKQSGSKPAKRPKPLPKEDIIVGKEIRRGDYIPMEQLREDSGKVCVEGSVAALERKQLPGGSNRSLILCALTDLTNTVQCKIFVENTSAPRTMKKLERIRETGHRLRVRGECAQDRFSRELSITVQDANRIGAAERTDTAPGEKRVELHLHTQMSAMDGLTEVSAAVKTAARWGHKAIAVTDHGVVQAFPELTKAAKKAGIKPIFGVEGYLKPDCVLRPMENQRYVVFDLETTGLKAAECHIIEIGAVKLENGQVADRFSTFVDPGAPIPPNITELTGITNAMVQNAPRAGEALRDFAAFCADATLLAGHNAAFDMGFVRLHGDRHGIPFNQPYVDTLNLSRCLRFNAGSHKLNAVCEDLGISLEHHHRAVDDAEATAQVLLRFLGMIREIGKDTVPVVTKEIEAQSDRKKGRRYHIVLLAKTQAGMMNLYRLVSLAHLEFFQGRPQIPRSLLNLYRDGLILGSACEQGELFRAMLAGEDEDTLTEIADRYDYLEIQPLGNNAFLLREGAVTDEEGLRELNRRIVALGEKRNKPVVATGDVHFLDPTDAQFRAIIMNEMGYQDADTQAPLYFKTTDEMLAEFAYLGEEKAYEVVVTNPNAIAESCEAIKPYPDGTHAPVIEHAEELLRNMAETGAAELYGDPVPEPVRKRLDKELNSIINNGFASLYMMAQRLVQKSLSDGYLVGSRGSVGSSFVATMAGITEVNPLPPHYACPGCKRSEFDVDRTKFACGVDMPDKLCPDCGTPMKKLGYDIPFEVFLGFKGDKTPDIDLNFSGEYQPRAHSYTEEMFGDGHAFRAGTISAIKDKIVYGYVMKYLEQRGKVVSRGEIDRLCAGCAGVKKTTGQHPGGMVIVPEGRDILEFTPIQHPADQKEKNTVTTHFDFHALDDRLVKLDILGHDDPTALKMLQDLTGIDPRSIPLDDPETMKMYSSVEPLGIDLTELHGCDVGSLGIPEFGTGFVRKMLMDTRPTTMEELVRIAGLSHGTDVWLGNAETLVLSGTATLSQVICTRDDIMNYLMAHGLEPSISFKTMESVRKGRGLTPEMEQAMAEQAIPDWFVDSCKKIKYMFPRAHAVAYVMMSYRIAWHKVHNPLAFYAVYYTVRADAFDVAYASGGAKNVLKNIRAIEKKGREASAQEKNLLTILEVVYEMNLRGIELLPVDIYRSDATRFLIEDGAIRPPFSAVGGVGENAAIAMAKACRSGERFLSVEDFQMRTRANSAVITALTEAGCFEGMGRTNQLSLFEEVTPFDGPQEPER